jgi:hypothetical protein
VSLGPHRLGRGVDRPPSTGESVSPGRGDGAADQAGDATLDDGPAADACEVRCYPHSRSPRVGTGSVRAAPTTRA